MFGLFKKPLDSVEFNNIYTSCFVRLAVEGNSFPSSQAFQSKINEVLRQFNSKLTLEQEKSIRIVDALMPSQKESLIGMANGAYLNVLKGDSSGLVELTNRFKRLLVLRH